MIDDNEVPKPTVEESSEKKTKLKITKEEYARVKNEYDTNKKKEYENQNKKKPWSWGWNKTWAMNASAKKPDEILIFMLNLKRQIEGPIITKIYGGNFFVIRNHVYRLNPDRVFSMGKYKAGIAREFDREMVGIDDYENLVRQDRESDNPGGRVNVDDPVLIKALIQAKLAEKQTPNNTSTFIIVGLVILGLIVGFMMFGGKKTTPTPAK